MLVKSFLEPSYIFNFFAGLQHQDFWH